MPEQPIVKPPSDPDAILTTDEIAAILHTSPARVRAWTREGLLAACTPAKRPRVYRWGRVLECLKRIEEQAQGHAEREARQHDREV